MAEKGSKNFSRFMRHLLTTKGLGVYIAEGAECHLQWEYTRGLDDFDDSFGTEKGRLDGHEQLQRYQFDACVCEDCGGSDSSAYQLCI